jgi:hypothetical protein
MPELTAWKTSFGTSFDFSGTQFSSNSRKGLEQRKKWFLMAEQAVSVFWSTSSAHSLSCANASYEPSRYVIICKNDFLKFKFTSSSSSFPGHNSSNWERNLSIWLLSLRYCIYLELALMLLEEPRVRVQVATLIAVNKM